MTYLDSMKIKTQEDDIEVKESVAEHFNIMLKTKLAC